MLCTWTCILSKLHRFNPCRCRSWLDCGVYLQRLYRSRSHSHAELRFVVSHAVAAARNATANVITPLFHREWHIAAKGGRYSFAIPTSGVMSTAGFRVTRSYMNGIASAPCQNAILICEPITRLTLCESEILCLLCTNRVSKGSTRWCMRYIRFSD